MLLEHLRFSKPGGIRTILCDNVSEVLSDLELSGMPKDGSFRIAVCRVHEVPELEELLDCMVRSLAEIAMALFPFWYAETINISSETPDALEDLLANELELKGDLAVRQKISVPWLKAAAKCCSNKSLPLPARFAREIQASQLAFAIGCENLSILVAADDIRPRPENLIGFVKAVEWLSRVTEAPISVLIPKELADFKELAPVLYDALTMGASSYDRAGRVIKSETKHLMWPIEGNPHPLSPGEQELAKWLSKDPELASLFQFNRTVTTVRENRFMVDLLWPEGKVVVEVDGYNCHSNRYAFCQDRNRDYELVISGYLVLRLPHDEVLHDVMIALDKIRDMVRFRHENPSRKSEDPK